MRNRHIIRNNKPIVAPKTVPKVLFIAILIELETVSWIQKTAVKQAKNGSLGKNNKQKNVYLGDFINKEQAFQCYKKFKENYIKEVAEEYKNLIPTKLYEAMYKYEVEITD